MVEFDAELVRQAKAIVALALQSGPIEAIHSGTPCPTCSGEEGYSRITDAEMKTIMKNAVSQVFRLLWLRDNQPEEFQRQIRLGSAHTESWDAHDVGGAN